MLGILRDRKIGQVEFGAIRSAPLDSGLNQDDLLFAQHRITLWPTKAAIGVQGVQVRALLELGEGGHEQFAIFGGVRGYPHIRNELLHYRTVFSQEAVTRLSYCG